MEAEVTYDGNKFKITITTDSQLRIKVPNIYQNTSKSETWIRICKEVLNQLIEKGLSSEFTLRGKGKINNFGYFYNFNLQSEHTHSGNTKVSEIKCLINEENNVDIQKFHTKETE